MQLRAKPRRKVIINITSLIDVTFMMLLFFMITSTFLEQPGIKLVLPNAKTSTNNEAQEYVLTLDKKGELFLNRKPLALTELEAAIRRRVLGDCVTGLALQLRRTIEERCLGRLGTDDHPQPGDEHREDDDDKKPGYTPGKVLQVNLPQSDAVNPWLTTY